MSFIDVCSELPEVRVLLEILRKSNTSAYMHSFRVARLAEEMLEGPLATQYVKGEQIEIIKGALLHDIGKAFVPLNLTQKESLFTASERAITEIHSLLSYEITMPVFSEIVQNICLYHHERLNGTGYPERKSLAELPLYVLMIQVCDIYDALISNRSYKMAYSKEQALEIMQRESMHLKLDDYCLEALEQIIAEQKEE